MEVLYLDLWFALNLLCDYLLCLLTARAAGLYLKRRRYLLAALLGAFYACMASFPGFSFLARRTGTAEKRQMMQPCFGGSSVQSFSLT